jgi:hypothetical protein
MDDGREALSEIDRAIAEALDVDVSPEFMARVRRRIADEPVRAPLRHGWRLALPMAAVTIVLVAAGVSMLLARRPALVPASASGSQPRVVEPARGAVERPSPPPLVVTGRVATTAGRPVAPAPASSEPEVLVPREEIEMYRGLVARAAAMSRPVFVEARDIVPPGTISDITIDPIRIELIMPPAGGEGDRQ